MYLTHRASDTGAPDDQEPIGDIDTIGTPTTFTGVAPTNKTELDEIDGGADWTTVNEGAYVQLSSGKWWWNGTSWERGEAPA